MTLEKFKHILKDCHVDDQMYMTEENIEESYKTFDIEMFADKGYLCFGVPTDNELSVVILWVDPKLRGRGLGTELLNRIDGKHSMVVDFRSTEMHRLLTKLGYSKSDRYMLDGQHVQLHGGDLHYSKENYV